MIFDYSKEAISFDELINSNNLYSLCIPFFNLTNDNKEYFIIESYYRKSKFSNLELDDKLLIQNNILISSISDLPFLLKDLKHCCYIKKTKNINNSNDFFDALYKKIQRLREKYDDNLFSKIICASLFFPRGSWDGSTLFAVDIYRKYQNKEYLNKMFFLLTSIGNIKQLNFNFRELQKQHLEVITKRNTQIRINIKWFCNELLYVLQEFNIYKFNILENNLKKINQMNVRKKIEATFFERIQFYIANILESKDYNWHLGEIKSLRKVIGFDYNSNEFARDSSVVKLARKNLPDFCSGCVNKYELKDRTFKYKNSEKWYLEINHVISFANNNVDQIDNLCKLCPACHKALTPNRTGELLQKEIISSILKNNPIVSEYINLFIDSSSLENKVNYIFSKLK